MTGVQALERKAPDLPLAPGIIQRRDFEYIRHGTQALIINPDVVTGQVVSPTLFHPKILNQFLFPNWSR
jgi:putative transposase